MDGLEGLTLGNADHRETVLQSEMLGNMASTAYMDWEHDFALYHPC